MGRAAVQVTVLGAMLKWGVESNGHDVELAAVSQAVVTAATEGWQKNKGPEGIAVRGNRR